MAVGTIARSCYSYSPRYVKRDYERDYQATLGRQLTATKAKKLVELQYNSSYHNHNQEVLLGRPFLEYFIVPEF